MRFLNILNVQAISFMLKYILGVANIEKLRIFKISLNNQ